MNSREMSDVFPAKDEEHHNNNAANNEKGSSSNPPSSSSLLSSWSRLKDPRIVRVSRAFGGKDRHSKVCTVRGLRDRRVRLSVPTAIQLYDLQDRLGLNQPSKVVDWLLNVAKNEIDELPPLQMPAVGGNLIEENFRSILGSHLGKEVESNVSNPWISDTLLRNNDKEVEGQGLSLVNNSSSSEQQFMTWDSSSSSTLSLAQSRNSAMCSSTHDDDVHHRHHHHQQHDHHHHHQSNFNVLPFMTSATHQVLVYPPHQSYFGSSNINLSATTTTTEEEENEDYVPKQFSFHMLDSSSENVNRFSNPQDLQF